MIQSDHNIVINKRFVNPELLIPIILIFIPLLVSGSDSLLTFSIHKREGGEADGCRRKMLKSCCTNQKWGGRCCKEKEQKREKKKNSLGILDNPLFIQHLECKK